MPSTCEFCVDFVYICCSPFELTFGVSSVQLVELGEDPAASEKSSDHAMVYPCISGGFMFDSSSTVAQRFLVMPMVV